ncbi:GNAT family N-acetyltransferase [Sandaracinus amylolyticus]|uniref:GNAT family N-acetyltransferase n=1 Tax=Sandaracinus amylolyticus TaxID=927083 RepID=UPI001F17FFE9|nr:GNAT family N-acetyltransferase [Sandaracinus amylolyticus]UJR78874.1 L-amino acid N-acyltransferase YncA [Sandaracinus amylolyticus]
MSTDALVVRAATENDLPAMAAMAADLVRFHHALDPARFFLARGVEQGYREWFGRELPRANTILLVATKDDAIVGYAYGRVEGRDWNMLLDKHAALHDVFVSEDARGTGAGERLVRAFCARARALGAPRVVLSTATSNTRAQKVFARCGFRPTMIEMTRECADDDDDQGAADL